MPHLVMLITKPGNISATNGVQSIDKRTDLNAPILSVLADVKDVNSLIRQLADIAGQVRRLGLQLRAERQPGGVLIFDSVIDGIASQQN